MYQVLIIMVVCVSSVIARPQTQATSKDKEKEAVIIHTEDERDESSYKYKYWTSNGISRAEIGSFEETSFETGIAKIEGYYSYVGPDNIRYTVTYIADENGYQPKIHKSDKNLLPSEVNVNDAIKIEGIDDDRIGTKLLISLGGGNIG